MNWDAIGAIGNAVGAVAVTATLGYLVVQLRHNNRQLRLTTANIVTEELQAMFSLLAADADLVQQSGVQDRAALSIEIVIFSA